MSKEFDPEDEATWPNPHRPDDTRSHSAWADGFARGLQMCEHFNRTGRWPEQDRR